MNAIQKLQHRRNELSLELSAIEVAIGVVEKLVAEMPSKPTVEAKTKTADPKPEPTKSTQRRKTRHRKACVECGAKFLPKRSDSLRCPRQACQNDARRRNQRLYRLQIKAKKETVKALARQHAEARQRADRGVTLARNRPDPPHDQETQGLGEVKPH